MKTSSKTLTFMTAMLAAILAGSVFGSFAFGQTPSGSTDVTGSSGSSNSGNMNSSNSNSGNSSNSNSSNSNFNSNNPNNQYQNPFNASSVSGQNGSYSYYPGLHENTLRIGLSQRNQMLINSFVDSIPVSQRLSTLNSLIARIAAAKAALQGGNGNSTRNARNITTLDGVAAVVWGRIAELVSNGTNAGSGSNSTSSGTSQSGGTSSGALSISSVTFSGLTSTGLTINFTSNASGTGFYVILSSGFQTPSPSQVRDGLDALGSMAAFKGTSGTVSGNNQINVTGLFPNTSYVAYFVAEDANGTLEPTVHSFSFQTPGP
jgi:hypothetical protein